MTVGTASPSVFDAGLPTLDYDVTATPQQVYPQLLAAQRLAPIALGPVGPRCFPTSWCEPPFETIGSRYHPATFSPSRASPQDRSGTRSSIRCWAWKAPSTNVSAASHRRHSPPRAVERLHATIVGVIDEIR
jgi:hypothetical protein